MEGWVLLTILVMTHQRDYSVDETIRALAAQGTEVFRIDTVEYPLSSTLSVNIDSQQPQGYLSTQQRSVSLDDVTGVWYRHPTPFKLPETVSEVTRSFMIDECRAALGGALRTLDCVWVNHPDNIVAADYKPYQLALAKQLGFSIPPTLITNDPDKADQFYRNTDGQVIYKTLTQAGFPSEEGIELAYTSIVSEDDRRLFDRVEYSPCLFQCLIPKAYELRITVIGQEIFSAEIYSQEDDQTSVDFRLGYDKLTYGYHELPEEMHSKIRALMQALELHFGAIDMIVTPDKEYVFLEINPAGQFGWIENELEFPMTEAFVNLLTGNYAKVSGHNKGRLTSEI